MDKLNELLREYAQSIRRDDGTAFMHADAIHEHFRIATAPTMTDAKATEHEQRRKMQERFAQRPPTPATADFDLPAPNDAVCESCNSEGIIGSHACPDCSNADERKRVELTDDEIVEVVKQTTGWSIHFSIPQDPLGYFYDKGRFRVSVATTIKIARTLFARAQAKGE